jgi:hypothetical protein
VVEQNPHSDAAAYGVAQGGKERRGGGVVDQAVELNVKIAAGVLHG